MEMQIKYDKLFIMLKNQGIVQNDFAKKANIGGATLNKMRNNDNINTSTICKICDYFHCMPDEIMEFIPDTNTSEQQKQELEAEKAEYEKKINEIQKKLTA